jgi:hypothetical protein
MTMTSKRACLVRTAQLWFDNARKAQDAGNMGEALLCMENAFNHTENALAALLQAARFDDKPPVTGRTPKTIAEVVAMIDQPSH